MRQKARNDWDPAGHSRPVARLSCIQPVTQQSERGVSFNDHTIRIRTHNEKVLDQVEDIHRRCHVWSQRNKREDPPMSLTDDLVLECLVVPDRIAVALAFMVFTIEILDRLVVE